MATEAKGTSMERLLCAALWGLRRYERYTAFAPSMTVVLPSALEVAVAAKKSLPLRL